MGWGVVVTLGAPSDPGSCETRLELGVAPWQPLPSGWP